MRSSLLMTRPDVAPLIARVAAGVVMFPHGAQKVLGWFGGPGFATVVGAFHQTLHIPMAIAVLDPIAEFFGALALMIGLLSRVAAFGILCVMLGAVGLVHYQNGFLMNWTGKQTGEGYEFHLLMMALCLIVIVKGGGAWSVDRALTAGAHRNSGGSPASSLL
jgi:putative oxidoreductase